MPFVVKQWKDAPDKSTPINAAAMIDMERRLTAYVDASGDKRYTHVQLVPAVTWTITHNLGKYPKVNVRESGGDTILSDVTYISQNALTLRFASALSGEAYLN